MGVHDAQAQQVVEGDANEPSLAVVSDKSVGDLLQSLGGCQPTNAGDLCVDIGQHLLVAHACPIRLESRMGLGDFHHGFPGTGSGGIVLGLSRSTDRFEYCHI